MRLSDNDANSTQLEGKKLKGRGVVEGYKLGGQMVEIEEDTPAIEEGTEQGQDIEIGQPDERETTKERDERLKREALLARQSQEALRKQQGLTEEIDHSRDPNLHLDQIEQGIALSRTKGRPVNKQEFKNDPDGEKAHHRHSDEHPANAREGATSLVEAVVGTIIELPKELQLSDKDKAPKGSIPATKVEDVRGKDGLGVGF